jgi:6-phosphofructokinase 1
LGGVGAWLARQIREDTAWDARAVALGHPQRGGPPSSIDRIMGHLFGSAAVEAAMRGAWGKMVSARGIAPACEISLVPLSDAVRGLNLVDVARVYDTDRYHVRRSALPAVS